MNIFLFLMTIFSQLNTNNKSSKVEPARLDKKQKSKFEQFCDKSVPYVLLIALALLSILIIICLVKYGHSITGTESNAYYYHLEGR